jgi:RNA polymerase primary sigma factor
LEQKFQREPSTEEIAESLDISVEEVDNNLSIASRQISVNAPFVQGEENGLLDVLIDDSIETPDAGLISDSLRTEVNRALSSLTERESLVITSYYGLNGTTSQSLEEIGDRFSLTRERVRQIKEKATRKLRIGARSKGLKAYLG